ncbi:MAG: hypothetical protein RBQ91_04285 [Acholeplasma sp.]|nr:hypothetical protein [Acholeplasma sp.]
MNKTMAKPINWQDFEDLCKKIWRYEYNCQDIKKNGRQGQSQNGVDVYGYFEEIKGYFGIQCKGKDDYTNAVLSENEIETEIEKAKNFKPQLKKFIFATTANKDTKIEEFVRNKDVENREKGLFSITLYSWEDITDLIKEHKPVFDSYVYDKHYSNSSLVDINICKESANLCPKYTRQRFINKFIEMRQSSILQPIFPQHVDYSQFSVTQTSLFPKKNGSYVSLVIEISNTGTSSLTNCDIILSINNDQNIYFSGYTPLGGIQTTFSDDDKIINLSIDSLNVGITSTRTVTLKFPDKKDEIEVIKDSLSIEWKFSSNQNTEPLYGVLNVPIRVEFTDLDDKIRNVYDRKSATESIVIKPIELEY